MRHRDGRAVGEPRYQAGPVFDYWHTNFATSQRGHMRLRYRLINPQQYPEEVAAM
jgi:hypothetical protein